MRFAYADPPYHGQCRRYEHDHGSDGLCWDDVATHRNLIETLSRRYPDGWALSLGTPNLKTILPMCPPTARVAAWVKPFASFKKGVRPAYCWEPVIFVGGRQSTKEHPLPVTGGGRTTPRDYHSEVITLKRGLVGAKPDTVCDWILDLLGILKGDVVDDLFVGSGQMSRAIQRRGLVTL